jgi:hypothetical protein
MFSEAAPNNSLISGDGARYDLGPWYVATPVLRRSVSSTRIITKLGPIKGSICTDIDRAVLY